MIGLALSGGGSRAMAFHLGCLRAMEDLELLQKVRVISTISGGSVIGAYYVYSPDKSFEEFESKIRSVLKVGFQHGITKRLFLPKNFLTGTISCLLAHAQDGLGLLNSSAPRFPRFRSRTDVFDDVLHEMLFHGIEMASPRRNDVQIVIGSCDLRAGTAFRFGNAVSGSWRNGAIVAQSIPVSFAVAASAAYPIFLPAFDRTYTFTKKGESRAIRVCLTDGGVYDNLGIQVLEPGRDANVSLHTFPCEYIISCNAGHGQEAGTAMPLGACARVARSFEVVHRRVQDNAMHHLHSIKDSGKLKGFAMPYLGQQDSSLPWKPSPLIPREEVIGYRTNFAPMSDAWIDRLSNRGEQLTRALISHYLPQLVR